MDNITIIYCEGSWAVNTGYGYCPGGQLKTYVLNTSTSTMEYQPDPAQLAEAFGTGFFVALPVVAVVYIARKILKLMEYGK